MTEDCARQATFSVSSVRVSARRRFAIGATGAAIVLALAAARTIVLLAGSGPVTERLPDPGTPIPLDSVSAIDQSFFVPACELRLIRVALASPVQHASEVNVMLLRADAQGWPATHVHEAVVQLPAGTPSIDVIVPQPLETWRRTFAIRLSLSSGPGPLLATRVVPVGWPGALRVNGAWQGRLALAMRVATDDGTLEGLACVFDSGRRAPRAALMVALGTMLFTIILLIGVLCAGGHSGESARALDGSVVPRLLAWIPAVLAGATGLAWLLVVPPFEGPDEMAHLQFARFVAATGTLPSTVPDQASPWDQAYYEWVQQPLYYVSAGAVLRAAGLADDAPAQEGNPRSILSGGRERTVYRHSGPPQAVGGRTSLYALRWLNLVCSIGVIAILTRLLRRSLLNPELAAGAACCLALVPQWSAILAMAGNDAPATLAATIACAGLARLASGDGSTRTVALAGVAVGFALATKLTTWFLVPMAAFAALAPALGRFRFRTGATLLGTIALASGWVPVRNLLVFGDPMASAFKRDLLDRSGFLALSTVQPGVGTPAFWAMLRAQVFEAFWGRFGSLGAGPDGASRLWLVYAASTVLIAIAVIVGSLWALRLARADAGRGWGVAMLAVGASAGLAGWVWINLAARADTIVHWTPRHVLPLSAPLLVLAALGAQQLRETGLRPASRRLVASIVVTALAGAWFATLRHVIQQFHYGY